MVDVWLMMAGGDGLERDMGIRLRDEGRG